MFDQTERRDRWFSAVASAGIQTSAKVKLIWLDTPILPVYSPPRHSKTVSQSTQHDVIQMMHLCVHAHLYLCGVSLTVCVNASWKCMRLCLLFSVKRSGWKSGKSLLCYLRCVSTQCTCCLCCCFNMAANTAYTQSNSDAVWDVIAALRAFTASLRMI